MTTDSVVSMSTNSVGAVPSVVANPSASSAAITTIQSNSIVGSGSSSVTSTPSSVSITKQLPAQESIMPRTNTILGLGMRKFGVTQAINKHGLASLEKFSSENNG